MKTKSKTHQKKTISKKQPGFQPPAEMRATPEDSERILTIVAMPATRNNLMRSAELHSFIHAYLRKMEIDGEVVVQSRKTSLFGKTLLKRNVHYNHAAFPAR